MPAASDSGRSAACSETLRSRIIADLEARMGQNPALGHALPQAEKTGRVRYQSTLRASRMGKITESLSNGILIEDLSGVHILKLEPIYKGLGTGTCLNF